MKKTSVVRKAPLKLVREQVRVLKSPELVQAVGGKPPYSCYAASPLSCVGTGQHSFPC
jgi:hypothetical protein